MPDMNIGQILQAFNNIESKMKEQNVTLQTLVVKVDMLEEQNKELVQLLHQLRTPSTTPPDPQQLQFQHTVTQNLKSLEDKSKKAIELIKSNGGAKKRAWP